MTTAHEIEFIINAISNNDTTTEAEKTASFASLIELLVAAAEEHTA